MKLLKKVFNILFSRLFLVGLMLLLQVGLLMAAVIYLGQSLFYVYMLLHIISALVVVGIFSADLHPSYGMTWITAVLVFPLIGGVFYLLFGNRRMPRRLQGQADGSLNETKHFTGGNPLAARLKLPGSSRLVMQSGYIFNTSGYPVWNNTASWYFPVGELMFAQMLPELEKAERFIFLEYFIIRPGIMWDSIFEILCRKVKQGVEVWLLYDDLGCINTLPKGYDKIIRQAGIRLHVFNPFRPRVNPLLNSRDHRKIMVIDGKTAFSGGINLADEYINVVERFGHWKDTGVMLKGDAVWNLSFMFLQHWAFATGQTPDYSAYRAEQPTIEGDGYIQPFCDSPLDEYNITKTAYLNIIDRATRYVYITTPYLIIDYEMEMALCHAAQSGVDVRIVTPFRYDKWYVHILTRSHYPKLLRAGVKIYEYTPGFMHGKMFVSDDKMCMVGTCNMDFRSFFLHFECSVAFYHSPMVAAVKEDIEGCFALSHAFTLEESLKSTLPIRVLRSILKMFAPLM